ncbi:MAG: hypothetical protein EBX40_04775, partial [Gammaproteobacteria bacterium]|nr:hypothetical protein [Gammaproteobacteria bacterium]
MNCFYALLLITFILKCYFAALVPITGDEAEYAYWGEFPALGYYDHPPLIGWIMALVTSVSTHSLWLRLPQVLSSTVFAILMVRFLAHFEEGFAEKAYWIGCAYLLSPVSLFDQGILTDTPLMWFTFFSVLCLLHAESSRHSFLLYLLAGLSLGAAYFSKFLMFPVAFGILIYLLLARPLPHRLFKMTLIALGFLPFLLQTLWWNLHHDWVNFAFNLTLRNTNLHFSFNTVILYGLMMLYLFSPLLLYYLIYRMPLLFKQIRSPKIGASHAAILTSLLFFFGLSFSRSVGLHWIFCAYPFAFVSIAWITKASECKRIAKWMLFLILPQILIVIVAGNLSASTWKKILPSHAYQTINERGINCVPSTNGQPVAGLPSCNSTQMEEFQAYRLSQIASMQEALALPGTGAFVTSCFVHEQNVDYCSGQSLPNCRGFIEYTVALPDGSRINMAEGFSSALEPLHP